MHGRRGRPLLRPVAAARVRDFREGFSELADGAPPNLRYNPKFVAAVIAAALAAKFPIRGWGQAEPARVLAAAGKENLKGMAAQSTRSALMLSRAHQARPVRRAGPMPSSTKVADVEGGGDPVESCCVSGGYADHAPAGATGPAFSGSACAVGTATSATKGSDTTTFDSCQVLPEKRNSVGACCVGRSDSLDFCLSQQPSSSDAFQSLLPQLPAALPQPSQEIQAALPPLPVDSPPPLPPTPRPPAIQSSDLVTICRHHQLGNHIECGEGSGGGSSPARGVPGDKGNGQGDPSADEDIEQLLQQQQRLLRTYRNLHLEAGSGTQLVHSSPWHDPAVEHLCPFISSPPHAYVHTFLDNIPTSPLP